MIIYSENFSRLKNKNLGSDDIVAMTKLEHIIRFERNIDEDVDDDDNDSVGSTSTDIITPYFYNIF